METPSPLLKIGQLPAYRDPETSLSTTQGHAQKRTMPDNISPTKPGRRQILIETQFGSARQSRSRKNRPCDLCRNRKTACVIAVEPPCRLCANRGLQCSFTSKPKPKTRTNPQHIQPKTFPGSKSQSPHLSEPSIVSIDESEQASPHHFRAPHTFRSFDSYRTPPTQSPNNHLPLHQLAAAAASQLATSPEDSQSSPDFASNLIYDRNRRLSLLLNDNTEYSLEDSKDFTAHFIGLSGEQDTNLFASIRYNVLNEINFVDFNIRQVFPGDILLGKPPIHFSIVQDSFPDQHGHEHTEQITSDPVESYVGEYADVLLKLYFRFVHPVLPVLCKSRILRQYATDKLSIPISLRGAIYGLASAFLTQDSTLNDLPPISQVVLFDHTHTALNRELESPKLSTLQACLLVLHQQPEVNGLIESPRTWVLACQATACAQSLGLHQDPTSWKLAPWEKKLRRKLWWATYLTDMWTSICHGNTPHISEGSFDTSDMDLEDIAYGEDVIGVPGCHLLEEGNQTFERVHALRFLELLKLTKLLGLVLRNGFTLQSYSDTIRNHRLSVRENALFKVRDQLESWLIMLPQSLAIRPTDTNLKSPLNFFLHLAFLTTKFFTLRAIMSPATSSAKTDVNSKLRRHFDAAMCAGEQFMDYVAQVGVKDMFFFWPRQSRTSLIISTNFLIYLFFLASTEKEVAHAYEMLQKYRDLLKSSAKSTDWSTIGLIRPSLLRVESFFRGAADGIRTLGQK